MPRGVYDRTLTMHQRAIQRGRIRDMERAKLAVKTAKKSLVTAEAGVERAVSKRNKRAKLLATAEKNCVEAVARLMSES
jgi:cell division ATPase FtsA